MAHSNDIKSKVKKLNLKLSYSGCVIKDPHPTGVYEGLPAQLNVSDVFDASQDALADDHMAVTCVIAMPILVDCK